MNIQVAGRTFYLIKALEKMQYHCLNLVRAAEYLGQDPLTREHMIVVEQQHGEPKHLLLRLDKYGNIMSRVEFPSDKHVDWLQSLKPPAIEYLD